MTVVLRCNRCGETIVPGTLMVSHAPSPTLSPTVADQHYHPACLTKLPREGQAGAAGVGASAAPSEPPTRRGVLAGRGITDETRAFTERVREALVARGGRASQAQLAHDVFESDNVRPGEARRVARALKRLGGRRVGLIPSDLGGAPSPAWVLETGADAVQSGSPAPSATVGVPGSSSPERREIGHRDPADVGAGGLPRAPGPEADEPPPLDRLKTVPLDQAIYDEPDDEAAAMIEALVDGGLRPDGRRPGG